MLNSFSHRDTGFGLITGEPVVNLGGNDGCIGAGLVGLILDDSFSIKLIKNLLTLTLSELFDHQILNAKGSEPVTKTAI